MGEVRNTYHDAVMPAPDVNANDLGPSGPYNGTVPPDNDLGAHIRHTFDNAMLPTISGSETPGEVIRTSVSRTDIADAPAGGSVDFMQIPGSGTKAGGFK